MFGLSDVELLSIAIAVYCLIHAWANESDERWRKAWMDRHQSDG